MEYTRMRTSLLMNRIPDGEILAIAKYQMLCAHMEEYAPSENIVLRFMSAKQYKMALQYYDSIKDIVVADIRALTLKRGRDKKSYRKNKDKPQIQMDLSPDECTGFRGVKIPPMKM